MVYCTKFCIEIFSSSGASIAITKVYYVEFGNGMVHRRKISQLLHNAVLDGGNISDVGCH